MSYWHHGWYRRRWHRYRDWDWYGDRGWGYRRSWRSWDDDWDDCDDDYWY